MMMDGIFRGRLRSVPRVGPDACPDAPRLDFSTPERTERPVARLTHVSSVPHRLEAARVSRLEMEGAMHQSTGKSAAPTHQPGKHP